MKILHTADWHIGKTVNGFSMLMDQENILKQIIDIIQEEKPDVVIIAGDLYDRSIPSVGAVKLLNETLREIVKQRKTKVIAIAGNHDSNERLQFGSDLLKDSGLFLIGTLQNPCEKIICQDVFGEVHFYPIPYMDPEMVAEIYADETIHTHEEAMQRIILEIEKDLKANTRAVAIAHGYFSMMKTDADKEIEHTELQCSDSEKRLAIGGSDLVHAKCFQSFHYTALGHLHGHQKVGDGRIKYSGSPLKYSFSEVNHKKGVLMIELDEHGNVDERFITLHPVRDFRIVKGYLNEILGNVDKQGADDYIRVELLDSGELIGTMAKLQSVYPNAMELVRIEKEQGEAQAAIQIQVEGKTPIELYQGFYQQVTGDKAEERHIQWLESTMNKIQKGERAE